LELATYARSGIRGRVVTRSATERVCAIRGKPPTSIHKRSIDQSRTFSVPYTKSDNLWEMSNELNLAELLLQAALLILGGVHAGQRARGTQLLDDHRQAAPIRAWSGQNVVEIPIDRHVAGPGSIHPVIRMQGVR